ncbi:helix-turn-helix domain-containing protein [Myroides sp. LJL116]
MKTVKAFIERGTDGTYGVYVDLEDKTLNYGIHGEGYTVNEAVNDFKKSYEEMKAFYQKKEKEFVEANFSIAYDIPSFLEYYSKVISLAGLERLTGVNQGQLSHYLTGHRRPSKKTTEKIQSKLHEFGKELVELELIN